MLKVNEVVRRLEVFPGFVDAFWGSQTKLGKILKTHRVLAVDPYPLRPDRGNGLHTSYRPAQGQVTLFGATCEDTVTITILYHAQGEPAFKRSVEVQIGRSIGKTMWKLRKTGREQGEEIIFDVVVFWKWVRAPKLGWVCSTYAIYECDQILSEDWEKYK
jgi:hypothetical protein